MKRAALAVAAVILSLPLAASAAGKDELWEVTTQMNMPGLPAGMGGTTVQVCQDKDPRNQVVPGADDEKCKVSDLKQSGAKTSMTVTCPDSKTQIEHTYNAARTEYKGSMRTTSRDGDMTVNTAGRKIGNCDAAQARRKQDAQVAAIQSQAAQQQDVVRKQNEVQIRECAAAAQTMDYAKLGVYGQCRQQPEYCKGMAADSLMKSVATACSARQAEYCKRYRTEDGFLKAKADPRAAEGCGLSVDKVKAELCPGALQKESLAFLGRYCVAEAKPLAEKHCAGRDFTALRAKGGKGGDKYDDFCVAYLSNASLADAPRTRPAAAAATAPAPAQSQEQPASAADAVTDTINQGISSGVNKLKGLFGR